MIDATSAVGWKDVGKTVGSALSAVPRGGFGVLQALNDTSKLYNAGTALPEIKLGYAANGNSIGAMAQSFCRWLFGDVIGKGAIALRDSNFYGAIKEAVVDFSKIGAVGEKIAPAVVGESGAIAGIGARGALVGAGHIGLVLTAIIGGAMLAYTAYKKGSEVDRGFSLEVVQSQVLDGIQTAMGAGISLAGFAAVKNPFVGAGIAAACFATSKAVDGIKWMFGGANWFRYPNLAPYGTRWIFRGLRNPGTADAIKH